MKFSASSIASLLFLSTASARLSRDERRAALAKTDNKRAFFSEHSKKGLKPLGGAQFKNHTRGFADSTGGPGGFAGTLLGGSGISKVTAVVTVPTVELPPGAVSGTSYGVAAWVGVQGSAALWQTGLTITVSGDNEPDYGLFYEWYPEIAGTGFSQPFSYGPGDQIAMTITAGSSTSGTAVVENLSTSQSATITVTGMSDLGGRTTADFTLEDFGEDGGSIPFAAWSGAFQFTGCSFSDSTGSGHGISGGDVLEVSNDGSDLTQFTMLSSSSFSVTYIGNSGDDM